MKVYLYCDEWYPVYGIDNSLHKSGDGFDVEESKVKEWEEIFKSFDKMQGEMAKIAKFDTSL